MVANLILRHIYEILFRFLELFSPRLTSKMQYDKEKNGNFMLITNSLKKLQKNHVKKVISKKRQKNRVLGLKLLLCELFCIFFQRIRTQHRILRFMIPTSIFCQNIFCLYCICTFWTKRLKKRKTYFINVSKNPIFYIHSSLGGSICKKKSKSLFPIVYMFKTVILL
jgi:hypothetical protein